MAGPESAPGRFRQPTAPACGPLGLSLQGNKLLMSLTSQHPHAPVLWPGVFSEPRPHLCRALATGLPALELASCGGPSAWMPSRSHRLSRELPCPLSPTVTPPMTLIYFASWYSHGITGTWKHSGFISGGPISLPGIQLGGGRSDLVPAVTLPLCASHPTSPSSVDK